MLQSETPSALRESKCMVNKRIPHSIVKMSRWRMIQVLVSNGMGHH